MTLKEAIEHASKFGVTPQNNPEAVVTESGNVYLNDNNIDLNDKGERFYIGKEKTVKGKSKKEETE
jgi:hypothetical protein